MITKFNIFENNNYHEELIRKIKSVLTPDLLKGYWKKHQDPNNPMGGHCYAATEALYWMLGGTKSDWKTYVLNNLTWSEGLKDGETHWFIRNTKTGEILDPTKEQFGIKEINYDGGKNNTMMNYPNGGSKRAREIIRRISEVSESLNESTQLSGKHSFSTFLQIVSNHDYNFMTNEYYRNTYNYHFFFSTETINEIDKYIEIFKYKKSLESSYEVLQNIKGGKLSFFFGVKDNSLLRYGFLDLNSKRSYVVGEFRISGFYFRSIAKYKAVQFINKIIQNSNVKKLPVLSKIKQDFENFYKDKKSVKTEIVENKVIKSFDKSEFSDDDINMNRTYRALDEWISKKSWKNHVECSVDDTVEPIQFIIIVK